MSLAIKGRDIAKPTKVMLRVGKDRQSAV